MPSISRVLWVIRVDLMLVDARPRPVFGDADGQGWSGAVDRVGPRTEVIGTPVVPAVVLVKARYVGEVINGFVVRKIRSRRRPARRILLMGKLGQLRDIELGGAVVRQFVVQPPE